MTTLKSFVLAMAVALAASAFVRVTLGISGDRAFAVFITIFAVTSHIFMYHWEDK